ncbi:MAG: C25 family cysteine peptidase [Planctomycetota bacterium]
MNKQKVPTVFLGMVVLSLFLLASASLADYYSQVSGHGTGIDAYNYGNWGTLSLSWEDTGYYDGIDSDQILVNKTWANVGTGRSGAGLWGTTDVNTNAPQKRLGPYGTANAWIMDYFTIADGQSGLNQGDPVQILFFTELNGRVVLHGTPSGSNQTSYNAQLWKGASILAELDYTTGGMVPPQNFAVNERVLQVVNVRIGDRIRIDARLYNWMNGSAHDPGTTETNYLDFCSSAIARLGYAPGYENILITSDANAPIEIPKPDLVITDIWNDNGVINYQILNDSIVYCPNDHTTLLKVDGQTVDSDTIRSILAPGERANRVFANSVWNCSPLDDTIIVTADVYDDANESDEQNNAREEIWKCDNDPPQITSGPTVSEITQTSAKFSWVTDEDSNSLVKYDKYAGKYDQQKADVGLNKEHEIILTDLKPSTLYHFLVESTDASDNTVTSQKGYFETLALADANKPEVVFMAATRYSLPMEFIADTNDNFGVERVEFFVDGNHVSTDYAAPFVCYLNPYFLGWEVDDLAAGHMVAARAVDRSDNMREAHVSWNPEDNYCYNPPEELELFYPSVSHTIYSDMPVSPPGQVELLVRAVTTVDVRAMMDRPRPEMDSGSAWGGVVSWSYISPDDLEFLLDGSPIPATYVGVYPYDDKLRSFMIEGGGLSVGSHPLMVRTVTDHNCVLTDSASIIVEFRSPEISITRNVLREDNRHWVYLHITNEGTRTVTLDRMSDSAIGFQCQAWSSADHVFDVNYLPDDKKSVINITFPASPINTLDPDEERVLMYMAVPVLYNELFSSYRIGGDGYIEYHDMYDPYRDNYSNISHVDSDGRTMYDSAHQAFKASDYLIVTNPWNLFRLHDPNDEVNSLLGSLARLAGVRNGVLGYYHSYYTLRTEYEGGRTIGVGDIFRDNKDEIIFEDFGNDTTEDMVRAYSGYQQFWFADEQLPIRLGIDSRLGGDAIAVGDVIPAEGADPRPRVEILLVDGHSPTPGEGRGDVTIYKFLPATDTFTTESFHIDYEAGWPIVVGDVLDGSAWDGAEILVARDDGDIDVWGELNPATHGTTSTVYEPGDWMVVGDVIGDDSDEIIIGDLNGDRVYVYDLDGSYGADMSFEHDLEFPDDIAAGDVMGSAKDEIVIADHSARKIYVYNFNGSTTASPTIVELPVTIEIHDKLLVADVIGDDEAEVLVARGTNRPANTGNIDILHIPDGRTFDDRFGLDELINEEHGDWAKKLAPSWCENGYLLIVGETPIIPTFSSWYPTGGDGKYSPFTDKDYASTVGDTDLPEIATGRIIGNTPADLETAVLTCIDLANGTYQIDTSNAYLVSGFRRGAGGSSDDIDFAGELDEIEPKLSNLGFSTLVESTEGAGAITEPDFFDHARNTDIIHLAGHGGRTVWDIISRDEVRNDFDPCDGRPLIYAMSCSTGKYPGGRGIAEQFLLNGVGAYMGASWTATLANHTLATYFYDRLDEFATIGDAFKDAKYDLVRAYSDRASKAQCQYNSAIQHLYGDPKLAISGLGGLALAAQQLEYQQAPPSSLQVFVPQYVVTTVGGEDHVEIPGHAVLMETGKPMVPTYTVTVDFPAGYKVQDVTMTGKGGLSTDMGLDIPVYVEKEPGRIQAADQISPEGQGWWPEREYAWSVISEPNEESMLVINIYPFYYNAATTQVKFYSSYNFDIDSTSSAVSINRLRTDKLVYGLGEKVNVDLYIYNQLGQAMDVIAEALVKSASSDIADGLGLQKLRGLDGLGSLAWQWDSASFAAGNYSVEVTMRQTNGVLLDRKACSIVLGDACGQITGPIVAPECFGVGNDVQISAAFSNTGDVGLSGSLVVSVQQPGGGEVNEFREDFNDLPPNGVANLNTVWNPSLARGEYRLVCYALYEGLSTPVEVWPETAAQPNADFNMDDVVNFDDFALLARFWKQNEPTVDVAPPAGDCIVNFRDLAVLAQNWLDRVGP